jgi:hypothetical protein
MKTHCLAFLRTLGCTLLLAVAALASERKFELPGNVQPSSDLLPTLEKMWLRSPTFRQQCQRIAATPTLTVRIGVGVRLPMFRDSHAVTEFERMSDGTTSATVCIFNLRHLVKFIGHEFEHLVEQIEGIHLQSLALQHGSGVYRTNQGYYETARAIKAGEKVYAEFRTARGIEY